MREVMLELMDALAGGIIHTEAMADELTSAAMALSDDELGARALRDTAVRRRVKAIELRGQLAALREDYAALFHLEQ